MSRISATRSRARRLRAASTGPAGRTPVRSRDASTAVRAVGAPPGRRSRSSACNWLISLVRWVTMLSRRSSSKASTVVRSSTTTGFASPRSAATLAAAAASMTSFLRRPPRDNSRTRAVAVEGTSSTTSSRATNHCANCRPNPRAFSTAHRRCSKTRRPLQESSIARKRRVDLQRCQHFVGARFHDARGVGALVRIDSDDDQCG